MTHDPLCPFAGKVIIDPEGMTWLSKRRIARLRAEVDRTCSCTLIARVREDGYRTGYGAAMQDGWDGYGAALRDAVEAVKRTVAIWDATDDYTDGLRDAVAAIRGLGGER